VTAARAFAPLRVALTFDAEHPDRPTDPDAETRLLDILESAAIPATFFIQGRWAEACPKRARRITQGPHLIGSHGFYHARMTLLSAAGLRADIGDAETAILDVTGRDPRPLFRCPFGAGMEDARVLAAIAAAGYRHVGWDVNVEDWMSGRDAQTIASCLVRRVLERHKAGQTDSIVLLHSWPAATGAGVEMAAARLREAGAELVTVDKLLPA
jgi:peptidoglycan/xylan/chitin deacetylase (PgdA/CDA1 family)